MKPIKQTTFGYPLGNCFAAAIASILEIDIAECPVNLVAEGETHNSTQWNATWDAWFAERGWARLCFQYSEEWKPKGWQIISGVSARVMFTEAGERVHHSVVGKDGVPFFDPHPDETFFEGPPTDVDILYPLDPAAMALIPSFEVAA